MKYYRWSRPILFLLIGGLMLIFGTTGGSDDKPAGKKTAKSGDFTGEILPVFYVSDLRKSLTFYKNLGFRLADSYEYFESGEDTIWTTEPAPYYLEMEAKGQKFALHHIGKNDTLKVGGMRHYFGVRDVDAHYKLVVDNGVAASEIYDRPWMRMFSVKDPDNHVLLFFTRPDSLE